MCAHVYHQLLIFTCVYWCVHVYWYLPMFTMFHHIYPCLPVYPVMQMNHLFMVLYHAMNKNMVLKETEQNKPIIKILCQFIEGIII